MFLVTAHESLSIQYERVSDIDASRVSHEMTLEVDALGHVTKTVSVGYGRGAPEAPEEQKKRWLVGSQQGLLALPAASASAPSAGSGAYRHGLSQWAKSWELDDTAPSGSLYTRAELEAVMANAEVDFETRSFSSAQKRLLTQARTIYQDSTDGSSALPYGTVDDLALVHESLALALNPVVFNAGGALEAITASVATSEGGYRRTRDLDDGGTFGAAFAGAEGEGGVAPHQDALWVGSGTQTYDPGQFFLVTRATDVFGNETTITYDGYRLAVVEVEDALSNTVAADIDYRVLAPKKITDINDNYAEAAFDALGRVIATAVNDSGGTLGDTLSDPTTRLTYADDEWSAHARPNYVKTEMREAHGGTASWLVSYAYTGGASGVVLSKAQVAAGDVTKWNASNQQVETNPANPRWVASGRTVIDNKGNPIKQYEPYFSDTEAYDDEEVFGHIGVTPVMHYDPLGRLIRTDLPDKTHTRVAFSPWEQRVFDQSDTLTTSSVWYTDRYPAPGSPTAEQSAEADAASKAVAHTNTPTLTRFDSLGRSYEVEQNDGTDTLTTKSELDVEGLVLSVTDANGRTCMSYTYGPLGQVLALSSLDAGDRWMLDGATGQPVRAGGERGFTQRVTYDALRRPTAVYVDDGVVEGMVQEMVYGESTTLPASQNVLGKLVERYDQSGNVVTDTFDFKGNPLIQKRQYADDVKNRLDWGATTPPTLIAETWRHDFAYDALNRPTSTTYPDGTEVLPTFDAGGMLESVKAKLRGATAATTIVESITYDEKGRRKRIVYSDSSGDHVATDYTYDPLTFRLQHFKTTRSSDGKLLQSLAYHYDPVGNVTRTRDTATKSAFFDGAITVPDVDGDYTYDAAYRLVGAKGREHAAVIGQLDDSQMAPKTAIPLGSDPGGLHEYTRTYAYDDVGNITSMQSSPVGGTSWTRTYTYVSGTNRLSTTTSGSGGGTVSYAHDAHGNMTAMPHLDTIEWDYADQMRHVDKSAGAGQKTWFIYDASGQRVRKVYEHNGVREERLYLGGFEVSRKTLTSTGVVQEARETAHLSDDHRRVCLAETKTVTGGTAIASPTTYLRFQLDNHLGTCAVEVDETGAVISYEEYHPYGTSAYRAQHGTLDVSAKRYRYTGKERDEETGLYYHGARSYAPWLGRWTAADPLAFADGTGSYTYVRGAPVVLSDPNGRETPPTTNSVQTTLYYLAKGFGNLTGFAVGGNTDPDQGEAKLLVDDKVGGIAGGVLEAVTLRSGIAPVEEHRSGVSDAGMVTGAGMVPFLDSGARVVTGKTVTGRPTSRLGAGVELALEVVFGLGEMQGTGRTSKGTPEGFGSSSVPGAKRKTHTGVPEMVERLKSGPQTGSSMRTVKRIEAGDLKVQAREQDAMGTTSDANNISVDPRLSKTDGAQTLVHEGQHANDIKDGVIPLPSEASRTDRLTAELRAYKAQGDYATANGLKSTTSRMARTLASKGARDRAVDLVESIPSLRDTTVAEIWEAIKRSF